MRDVMKVFVPITDEMLHDAKAIQGSLIPFSPELLHVKSSALQTDNKPANWISNSDYASARKRLLESRVV